MIESRRYTVITFVDDELRLRVYRGDDMLVDEALSAEATANMIADLAKWLPALAAKRNLTD